MDLRFCFSCTLIVCCQFIIAGPVILQAPSNISPGKELTLRCHSLPGYVVYHTKFYKDNVIRRSGGDVGSLILPGSENVSGRYRCEKRLFWDENVIFTDEASIPIRGNSSSLCGSIPSNFSNSKVQVRVKLVTTPTCWQSELEHLILSNCREIWGHQGHDYNLSMIIFYVLMSTVIKVHIKSASHCVISGEFSLPT